MATPFLGADGPPPVRVLLHQGDAAAPRDRTSSVGHFLTAQLSEAGFGDLRRVPLRVEAQGGETAVDEREGVVRLPEGREPFEVQAFSMAGENWGMFLSFMLPEDPASGQEGTKRQRAWEELSVVASFTGARLSRLLVLDSSTIQEPRLTRALATSTHWVIPIFFMGHPRGSRELAFHAWGIAKEEGGPSLPCAAILSLP